VRETERKREKEGARQGVRGRKRENI